MYVQGVVFPEEKPEFKLNDPVKKRSGSFWRGKVVGFYSTKQTPIGYCVQLVLADPAEDDNLMPVQLYPEGALVYDAYTSLMEDHKEHPYANWNKMFQFVMDHPGDDTWIFMKTWGEGDWTTLDEEWPEYKEFITKTR